jgi:hypothetical protein
MLEPSFTYSFSWGNSNFSPVKKLIAHLGCRAKLKKLLSVKRGGEVKPVRKSRSRFPPVIVSTVSASTSNLAVLHRSIMLLVSPLSLWKYNWKSFGVLIVEPISSTLTDPRDEMPNIVPNFSAALATALSPS